MVKEETREGEKLGDKWDTTKSQPNPFYVSVYFILKEIHGKWDNTQQGEVVIRLRNGR